jgi:hypothetical protein
LLHKIATGDEGPPQSPAVEIANFHGATIIVAAPVRPQRISALRIDTQLVPSRAVVPGSGPRLRSRSPTPRFQNSQPRGGTGLAPECRRWARPSISSKPR